jgi:hypothetical protein
MFSSRFSSENIMALVYLSSTDKDLKEYRDKVYITLRRMAHDVISREDYSSGGIYSLDKYLKDVAFSDYYVGILAWQYGYIPPRDNPQEKSLIELEYHQAKNNNKPTFIFILEETTPWPPNFIERGEASAKLEAFKNELKQDNAVNFFSSPDELANKVSISLNKWEKEHPEKLEEIQNKPTNYYDFRGANINNLANLVQGNQIGANTIEGSTFIGTQINYSPRTPREIWQEKLNYLQVQQAISSNPSVKFELEQQIQECQRKITELSSTQPREMRSIQPTKASVKTLTGEQLKQLREAILNAYPSVVNLSIVLEEHLNINLDSIKRGDNYALSVFNLIKDMEAQGRLTELLEALISRNPRNQALRRCTYPD